MSSAFPDDPQRPFRRYLSKVPEVTAFFWLVELLAATAGEPVAYFFGTTLDLGLTVTTMLMITLLAVVLIVQVSIGRYLPWLYWLAVVLSSLTGTLVNGNLVDILDVPLKTATIVFAALLIGTFALWYAKERTLSIHTIDTPRREAFYWVTVFFAFAFGTAGGGLGGFPYGVVAAACAMLIAATGFAYRFLHLGAVLAFWIGYVVMQPLGISVGALLAQPSDAGGLGLGTTATSAVTVTAIVAVVAYLSVTHRDQPSLENATRHLANPGRERAA
jgi:uncharacterized membrane-anchored protein